MEMTWPRDRFENDKLLGSGKRENLPRFQDHIATEKGTPNKNIEEIQKKKKGPKIGVLQTYPPYDKSRPRDLVAQGTCMNILT